MLCLRFEFTKYSETSRPRPSVRKDSSDMELLENEEPQKVSAKESSEDPIIISSSSDEKKKIKKTQKE